VGSIRAGRRSAWLDSVLLIVFAAILIWPLFRLKYLDVWSSIESTFISDARMLSEHWPHPGWQPLWYCGTRFDYIYPPALRYGTALLSKIPGVVPARAYHLYIAIYYVFGIVAVYWLVRVGSGSRIGAVIAAVGVALLSPSFWALPLHRQDSGFWVPQRLHSLMSYGEGPHISALCGLPAALALIYLALRRWNPLALAGAGFLSALVVANNFYGATALAIFFPILAWAVWFGHRDRRFLWRAAAIPVLAYTLCAFWLTPSYVKFTTINLQWVSQPGNNWSRITLLIGATVFCAITWHWGNRKPERSWAIFVWGVALFLSLYVLGLFYFGFRVAGEGLRLIPELDLAIILVVVETARVLWNRPRWRILAVLLLIALFYPSRWYLQHVSSPFPKSGPLESRYEYQIPKWVHDHLANERVMPAGAVRFWFDAWFDNNQPGGGSDQGMLNQHLPGAFWQIHTGDNGETALLWLQALGTDAVIVPDRTSLEWYHDFVKPEKFRGVAQVLFDDSHGTLIYRVPRKFPGIGRVVDRAAIAAVGPLHGPADAVTLARYDEVIDKAPAAVNWHGFDRVEVQAEVASNQSVLLLETYDPAWHAYENGTALTIKPEPFMTFMVIDVPAGNHRIELRFETPLENRIGQALFLAGLAAIGWLLWKQCALTRQPS